MLKYELKIQDDIKIFLEDCLDTLPLSIVNVCFYDYYSMVRTILIMHSSNLLTYIFAKQAASIKTAPWSFKTSILHLFMLRYSNNFRKFNVHLLVQVVNFEIMCFVGHYQLEVI